MKRKYSKIGNELKGKADLEEQIAPSRIWSLYVFLFFLTWFLYHKHHQQVDFAFRHDDFSTHKLYFKKHTEHKNLLAFFDYSVRRKRI